MKFKLNTVVQVIGVGLQLYNQYGGMVPTKYQPAAAAIVGAIQGIVALMAHFSNPDGTAAATAYVKK
jgi:hypothetical protein